MDQIKLNENYELICKKVLLKCKRFDINLPALNN